MVKLRQSHLEVGPSLGDLGKTPASGSCGLRLRSLTQPHEHKLSDQREALSRGQNPLPIYCALNSKEQGLSTFDFGGEWLQNCGPVFLWVVEYSVISPMYKM